MENFKKEKTSGIKNSAEKQALGTKIFSGLTFAQKLFFRQKTVAPPMEWFPTEDKNGKFALQEALEAVE